MCSWRKKRCFTKKLTTCKYRFARSRERLIHDFTVSTAHVRNIKCYVNFDTAYWIAAKTKPFLTISILKFSFLSLSMFVLLFKNMLPKSNAYANIRIIVTFFWIPILLSTYLETTGRNIILCVKMLLLRNKSHLLISMIVVKIEI